MITVVEIEVADTHPLRRSVLRDGTPSTEVSFDGDADGFHLGAFDGEHLVGVASWLSVDTGPWRDPTDKRLGRPSPAGAQRVDGVQLRGMATAPDQRGRGVGSALLSAGIERVGGTSGGPTMIVANARASALGFYTGHGFVTVGEVYRDTVTGLDHQRVRLDLPGTAMGSAIT